MYKGALKTVKLSLKNWATNILQFAKQSFTMPKSAQTFNVFLSHDQPKVPKVWWVYISTQCHSLYHQKLVALFTNWKKVGCCNMKFLRNWFFKTFVNISDSAFERQFLVDESDIDFMSDDSRKMSNSHEQFDGEQQCRWQGKSFWQRPGFHWRCQKFSASLVWIYLRTKVLVFCGNSFTDPQFISWKWPTELQSEPNSGHYWKMEITAL